ncbi:MAG TPA: ATP-binding protein [Bacteroidales bacterium]|nr:ATP-binding protein [Bacteroidales bacterium]HQM99229.1 ATP-binding protein [Bacteroidales bacterium]HQQ80397.1 ATP-binding protein [Bacteroidales bacterium]
MKQDVGFRLKVVFSYILLAALIAGAGWYVYKRVYPFLFQSDDRREEILERSLLISNTISLLYEAEWLGTRFIQDPKAENYDLYRFALDKVDVMLDSLGRGTTMERQQEILQEIDSLLVYRNINIQDIARQQKELSQHSNRDVAQKVDRALPQVPAMTQTPKLAEITSRPMPPVVLREEVIYDTITTAVHRPRQNFFERLGNAFAPSRMQDSITEIKQIRRTITDSLVRIIPGTPQPVAVQTTDRDTVVQAVMRVLDDVEAARQRQLRAISIQLEQLIETDRALNLQINKLLEELNQEWFSTTLTALETRRASLEKAGSSLSILGVAALLIILLSTLLIFTDLNKSRKYRRDLEVARSRAEELMKSREKLLLTVTHDIKAPLSAIIGYLDLLKHPSDKGPEQQLKEYLDPMIHSAGHVMELLANLLEYYRLDAHKTQLNPIVTPVRKLFEEAIDVFAPTAGKKGIILNLRTAIPPETCIITDPLRLRQVMMNLLSNAVKFTDKGHIDLHVSLDGPELFFSVYDTGKGIAPEAQKRIFDEFTREEASRTPEKEGVGLGLSIVKRTIELFKGNITLSRNEDSGSTFCVTIPIETTSMQAPDIPLEVKPVYLEPLRVPLRVLVVDDDPAQLALSTEMLRLSGHLVATAQGAEAAINIVKHVPVDVILTDIQMPNGDGFHLLEQIRRLADTPIIAVTANSYYTSRHFLDKGFSGHLAKPFVKEQLTQALAPITSAVPYELFSLVEMGRMVEADLDAVTQVLRVFHAATSESLKIMEKSLEQGDYGRIASVAHKMLPMFRQLQSPMVKDLIVLERSGKEDPARVSRVIKQAAELLQVIEFHFIV